MSRREIELLRAVRVTLAICLPILAAVPLALLGGRVPQAVGVLILGFAGYFGPAVLFEASGRRVDRCFAKRLVVGILCLLPVLILVLRMPAILRVLGS